MTATEFKELISSGKLKPKKGARYRFGANTATFGQLMEQMGSEIKKPLKSAKKPKIPRKEAKQLSQMKLWLYAIYGQHIEYEYKFAQNRRFRADIAIPEAKILIEYEGLNSEKSGHTTLMGYSKDTEKYNLASTLGFKVIRYTVMNYQNVISDVELLLKELNVTLRNTPDHGQEREH